MMMIIIIKTVMIILLTNAMISLEFCICIPTKKLHAYMDLEGIYYSFTAIQ